MKQEADGTTRQVAPQRRLDGKVALVYGEDAEIGAELARRYLAEGATVALVGRNVPAVQARLRNLDGALLQSVSLQDASVETLRAAVAAVIARHGRIDALVIAVDADRQRLDAPPAAELAWIQDCVAAVMGVAWNLARVVIPQLAHAACIIVALPALQTTAADPPLPYVAARAALVRLVAGLAHEAGAQGIRMNMIQAAPAASPSAVARLAVFLAGDEARALHGQTLDLGGAQPPDVKRATLTSRPGLRAVDAAGQVILICAGDQIEAALALAGVLRSCGAEVALGFRSRALIAQVEKVLEASRRLQGAAYRPPWLFYLDPLDPDSVDKTLARIESYLQAPDAAIILPARQTYADAPALIDAADATVEALLTHELAGVIGLALQLTRFWSSRRAELPPPRVIFLSNDDDGRGNVYADVLRASVECLAYRWRTPTNADETAIWANQIVRYVNTEAEGLDFACAWVAKLLTGDRAIDEIGLYLPERITETAGAQRPSFGWAEGLIGLHLGKAAVITGGSAGIGGQIGRLLALSGARVMLAARRAGLLEHTRERIVADLEEVGYANAAARVAITADCDVAEEANLVRLAERTMKMFGRVDYLINNAGITGAEEMVIDLPLDIWRHTLQANLISNYSLIRKMAPLMQAQNTGAILNVSSYFGGEKYIAVPYPNRADYAVSKAGQRALSEELAHFFGPAIQINTIAPGPVDGNRLRGTDEEPGLYKRRAAIILENKRLSRVYAALIEAHNVSRQPIAALLDLLQRNDVSALVAPQATAIPEPLRRLASAIWEQSDPFGSSQAYLMNERIAHKLFVRLRSGRYLGTTDAEPRLNAIPPEPFFTSAQIDREAQHVRDRVLQMLSTQQMPSDFDVALATAHYLADRNISGETFHPSGGLKLDRVATDSDLFGQASQEQLAGLRDSTVYLIGEARPDYLLALARAYLDDYHARQVVCLTESAAAAERLRAALPAHAATGRWYTLAGGDDIEGMLETACTRFGVPGPVVCAPFRALPDRRLIGDADGNWDNVLSEVEFADLVEQQVTHHFRVARKISLLDGVCLALVTPATNARSTPEEFALASIVRTMLSALTVTLGVENERVIHRVPVSQINLTRRNRHDAPRTPAEEREALARFIDAVMLVTAPWPERDRSRYLSDACQGRSLTI